MKTELSREDMRAALLPFDLRPRRVSPVEKGTINSNFRVDTDGGTVFVRINEGKREADVRYEGALLWHLGARRFPTPPPLRTVAGEPFAAVELAGRTRLVTVFPWWPGHELDAPAVTPAHATRVGEVLARLHLAAADFPERRAGIYTFERIVERVDGFRAHAAALPELAEVLPLLDEEIAFLRAERRPSGAEPLPGGTIHGDLFPDNVLWDGDAVPAVLDFEQASVGSFAYDLAVTLLSWCWRDGGLVESLAWAMVAGYQRRRTLGPAEREQLWVEARAAAFRFTVTRITDVYLPSLTEADARSQPPRPGPGPGAKRRAQSAAIKKDFRDYLARLLYLRRSGPDIVEPLVDERPPLRAV